jgi:dihydropyrimidine dehydrogenase (NAD+) subunit PreA
MKDSFETFKERQFALLWYGSVIGEIPEIIENITREVSKSVKIPVGVKLSPETGLLRVIDLAKRISNAGGKWIQSVNCGITIAPPDIFNHGKPIYPYTDGNPFVGTSGSWLRLTSYKHTAAISKFIPELDVAASGGISTPEQCVEAIMLGARQIQICTGIMFKGRKLIRQCNDFLRKFMKEQGYSSLEEMVGLGQKYIKYLEETERSVGGPYVAEINEEKCAKCGICADQFCIALHIEDGKPKVTKENCTGCGACMTGCRFDAISLVKV